MIDIEIALDLKSPNVKEHWTKIAKRNKRNDWLIRAKYMAYSDMIKLPCKVIIIRYSPREWDMDNYIFACKGVRDTIADLIIPNLRRGQADSSKDIKWVYAQEFSKVKTYRIQIESNLCQLKDDTNL